MISSMVRAQLRKVAEAGRVRAGLQEVEDRMQTLRRIDYTQVQPGREQGVYAEKVASYYSEISDGTGNTDRWTNRFKDTPYYEAAKSVAADDARYAVMSEKQELQRDLERIQGSVFRLKRRALEAQLAEYRLTHPAPPEEKEETKEKSAAPAWLSSLGQRAGQALAGTPARKVMTGVAAGAAIGGAGVAIGRRSKGKPIVSVSIPSKILNSKIFQTLFGKVKARFPNVPDERIKQLIYEAMKEKGVLEKVSGAARYDRRVQAAKEKKAEAVIRTPSNILGW